MRTSLKFSIAVLILMLVSMQSYCQISEESSDMMPPAEGNVKGNDKAVKQPKKKMTKEEKIKAKQIEMKNAAVYLTPVYMFCISAEFGDTIVYFTSIQEVDSVQLTKKYDFLYYRSYYSRQFIDWLATAYGTQNQTCAVFFDKDKKKLMKRFTKLLKKYENTKSGMHVVFVTEDRFKLQSVTDLTNVVI